MKIAVVTDSTANLSQSELQQPNLFVIPIPIIIDGKTYEENVDITVDNYAQLVETSDQFPKTSQSNVGDLIKLYNHLGDMGYDTVISIHLSSGISGMINTIEHLSHSDDLKVKLVPFNSYITVSLMGTMAVTAAQMATNGESLNKIMPILEALRSSVDEYFVVDDLKNLVAGGRLSNAGAFVGGLLNIKPLLSMKNDEHNIVAIEKVRSLKRAQRRIMTLFEQKVHDAPYPIKAYVFYTTDQERAQAWQETLEEEFPRINFELRQLDAVMNVYLGKGALALGWMEDPSALYQP
ncbi:degV family protein [Lactobacillus selangorensis]|uniref:DegV family protein n=1 Tax=Lactobacillus selangorensis TaxID=81857 RepID=A0A0R2FIV4_9LACO|nr:DegV family protein [Lactobacillus selangorensis]KRN28594.1 degV family protein [Lactobacillus selangorensis]KRN32996.1 degV family protein [Lactobacillus selangorensis]